MAGFHDCPIELVAEILKALEETEDLLSAVRSSRRIYAAWSDFRTPIMSAMLRNKIPPEALHDALAAFWCPRSRTHPWQPQEDEKVAALRLEYQRQVSRHVDRWRRASHEFPFPHDPADVRRLWGLVATVSFAARQVVVETTTWHLWELRCADRELGLAAQAGLRAKERQQLLALTRTEKARLLKALFHYEFLMRTLGAAGGDFADLDPEHRRAVLLRLSPVEMMQMLSVHNIVVDAYKTKIRLFEHDFIESVRRASKALGTRRPETESKSESKSTATSGSNTAAPPFVLNLVQHTDGLPYFSPHLSDVSGRTYNNKFISGAQSFGLDLYRRLNKATADELHEFFVTSYSDVVAVDRDLLATAYTEYCGERGCPIVQLNRPIPPEDGGRKSHCYPNTVLPMYMDMLRRNPYSLPNHDKFYLMMTGWWFWEDDRLEALAFESHEIFRLCPDEQDRWFTVRRRSYSMNPGPNSDVCRKVENLGIGVQDWETIVQRYRVAQKAEGDKLRGFLDST